LLTAALDNGFYLVAGLMLISSLLAVVYVWRVVEILYFSEPAEAVESAREAPWSMLIPTYLLIVGILVFGIWTSYSVGLASQAANALLGGAP
jgi:multicomponent Na+:H+ antiporter subunit D